MKTTFLVLIALIVSPAYATVRTVSNHPSTLAQFNTIQAAIDASAGGDTVLIHGSPIGYNSFTLTNKKICFLGPGRNPDLIPGHRAHINAGTGITISGALSSGTELHGLVIQIGITISAPIPSDLLFIRNQIQNTIGIGAAGTYTGYVFRGNNFVLGGTINGSGNGVYENFMIENNLVRNNAIYFMFVMQNCTNVFIHHNLFFNPANEGNAVFFSCSGLTLVNNIFNERNICDAQGLFSSVFINNITWNPPDSMDNEMPWNCGGNIDGGGNIADMNPMMVDQAKVDNGSAGALDNFTIPSGPADNSGSDGKDLGLLFDTVGELNWNHSRNSRIPSITLLNIANPVIGTGDSLDITIDARKNE